MVLLTVFAVMAATSLPFMSTLYRRQSLETLKQDVTQALRRAQQKAMAHEEGSRWGVSLQASAYVLYKGDSYDTRDQAFDETHAVHEGCGCTFGGDADVNFQPNGYPASAATITIDGEGATRSIRVNPAGAIDFSVAAAPQAPPDSPDLQITMSAPSDFTYPDPLTYAIDVTNAGAGTATAVVVTQRIPFSLTPTSWSGDCTADAVRVRCTLPDLAPSANASVTIDYASALQYCLPEGYDGVATVHSGATDFDSADNLSDTVHSELSCPP